jgi:hypothetical protein
VAGEKWRDTCCCCCCSCDKRHQLCKTKVSVQKTKREEATSNKKKKLTLSQAGLATGGLAKNLGAGSAGHDGLSVAEHSGDVDAAGALNVHEERVGRLHKALKLVLRQLTLESGVEEIDGELRGGGGGGGGK